MFYDMFAVYSNSEMICHRAVPFVVKLLSLTEWIDYLLVRFVSKWIRSKITISIHAWSPFLLILVTGRSQERCDFRKSHVKMRLVTDENSIPHE